MRNIRITLAYEGTAYSGFQRQENSITVQEILETALQNRQEQNHALLRRAHGCRRSCLRAGMHLYTESSIPGDRFIFALNILLPPDIRV